MQVMQEIFLKYIINNDLFHSIYKIYMLYYSFYMKDKTYIFYAKLFNVLNIESTVYLTSFSVLK